MTAPLAMDSTSKRTMAPAATVSGEMASSRACFADGSFPAVYGSRKKYHAATPSISTVSPRRTVLAPSPLMDTGLSHHGTL